MCFGGMDLEGGMKEGWNFVWFDTFKIEFTLAGIVALRRMAHTFLLKEIHIE